MTLLSIQSRFREIGRIRTGEKVTRGGKTYPTSLSTFRLTSSDEQIIRAAAEQYGGAPQKGEVGWEVVTTTDRLKVMLPPRTEPYSLSYELWSGGGIQRRCDGRDAIVGGVESTCLCDPEDRECAPTLRASFLLPDLPGLGVWRLETHGYNAAAELPGSLNLLSELGGTRIMRGVLRLEQRTVKQDGQTRKFVVPVLDPEGTLNELMAVAPVVPQLENRAKDDDLPLLPHEIEAAASTQPVPEGADPASGDGAVAARSDVVGTPEVSPTPEAGVTAAAGVGGSLPPASGIEQAVSHPPDGEGGEPAEQADVNPPSSPIEPAGAVVREEAVGARTTSTPPAEAEAGHTASALTSEQLQARYDWAERHGWNSVALDEQAVESMGETVMEMSNQTWVIFATMVKDGPVVSDSQIATTGAAESIPPKQGTDAYRALSTDERKAARDYWRDR